MFGGSAPSAPADPNAPSAMSVLGEMFFNGGGPAEAAEHLRELRYQQAMRPLTMDAMRGLVNLFNPKPQYQDGPPPTVQGQDIPSVTASALPSSQLGGGQPGLIGAQAASQAQPPANPWQYQAPQRLPDAPAPSLNDPATLRALMSANVLGVPGAKEAVDLLDKARPDVTQGTDGILYDKRSGRPIGRLPNHQVVNGFNTDLGAPGAPSFFPTLPGGTIPDGNGGVRNLSGLPQAIGAQEAAKVGATEAAKLPYVGPTAFAQASGAGAGGAPYEVGTYDRNGVPTTMTKQQAIASAGGAAPAQPSLTMGGAASALSSLVPGARITSMGRAPGHNSAVGGVPDSMHLGAQALDFVPPKGMTLSAFHQKLVEAGLPATELINEGDHFHWGWAPKGQAASAQPAPGFHGSNKDDQKTVTDLQAAAKQSEDLAALGHQFLRLNRQTATGALRAPLEVPIPFAHGADINLNIPGMIADKVQTNIPGMNNLSTQMALALRTPGQRITQMEFQRNLASVPGKDHLGTQNEATVGNYDKTAVARRAYANFASDYLAHNGSLTGVDAAYRAAQGQSSHEAPSGAKMRTYNPTTGRIE